MANKCKKAFEDAAGTMSSFPQEYEQLRIKDSIPTQYDWDELNTKTCQELEKVGCSILESELDPFWKENKTFKELLAYIHGNCNC